MGICIPLGDSTAQGCPGPWPQGTHTGAVAEGTLLQQAKGLHNTLEQPQAKYHNPENPAPDMLKSRTSQDNFINSFTNSFPTISPVDHFLKILLSQHKIQGGGKAVAMSGTFPVAEVTVAIGIIMESGNSIMELNSALISEVWILSTLMDFPSADSKARIKPQGSISLYMKLQQGFLMYVKISMKAGEGGKIKSKQKFYPVKLALERKVL